MRLRLTKHQIAIGIFSFGMFQLGGLAIFSGLFGFYFFAYLIKEIGNAILPLLFLAFAMFLPGAAMLTAFATIFLPISKWIKRILCAIGLVASLPAMGLYAIYSGRGLTIYVAVLIVSFLYAWGYLALSHPETAEPEAVDQPPPAHPIK